MKKLILSLVTLCGCAGISNEWCSIAAKSDYLIQMKSDSTVVVMDRSGGESEMNINNLPQYLKKP